MSYGYGSATSDKNRRGWSLPPHRSTCHHLAEGGCNTQWWGAWWARTAPYHLIHRSPSGRPPPREELLWDPTVVLRVRGAAKVLEPLGRSSWTKGGRDKRLPLLLGIRDTSDKNLTSYRKLQLRGKCDEQISIHRKPWIETWNYTCSIRFAEITPNNLPNTEQSMILPKSWLNGWKTSNQKVLLVM